MKIDALIKKRFKELNRQIAGAVKSEEYFSHGLGWGASALSLLNRVFGDSPQYQMFQDQFESFKQRGKLATLTTCRIVFETARKDYEGGYLFEVRGLIRAEVSDDVLEQATALL